VASPETCGSRRSDEAGGIQTARNLLSSMGRPMDDRRSGGGAPPARPLGLLPLRPRAASGGILTKADMPTRAWTATAKARAALDAFFGKERTAARSAADELPRGALAHNRTLRRLRAPKSSGCGSSYSAPRWSAASRSSASCATRWPSTARRRLRGRAPALRRLVLRMPRGKSSSADARLCRLMHQRTDHCQPNDSGCGPECGRLAASGTGRG
jgi:hypothetical protein